VDPDQLARMLDIVAAERDGLAGFDVAVSIPPGGDPGPYLARGATWVLRAFQPHDSVSDVQALVEAGPG
ncbi:MAG TPA: LLM class flavin-dependent oxidoreductase, partial [Actinomycetota bacterium]|nr:LLM class flavin-dependent oxidoreductase [Actinomycetota bacterium]